MAGVPVPLTDVLMALSLHEGKGLMRALRLGASITCDRHGEMNGVEYILRGAVNGVTVTTGRHRSLNGALVTDLAARLEPYLYRRVP